MARQARVASSQGEVIAVVETHKGAIQVEIFDEGERRGPRDFTVRDAGSQAAAFLGLDLDTRPSPIPANRRAAVRLETAQAEHALLWKMPV